MHIAATWLAALSGVIASILWIISAFVHEAASTGSTEGIFFSGKITIEMNGKMVDLVGTLKKQSKFNSYAAFGSAVAAVLGVVSLLTN